MATYIDPSDLIDASAVAKTLGLANRTSVSVYQRRYPTMPRPLVDLGRGRTKLWSKTAIATWARSADLRGPQAIASTELAELTAHGKPLARGVFRSAYVSARQHALGGGRNPREIDRSRRSAYEVALNYAQRVDPAFRVTLPDGWLDEPLTHGQRSLRGVPDARR